MIDSRRLYDDPIISRVSVTPKSAFAALLFATITTSLSGQAPRLSVAPAVVAPGSIVRLTLAEPGDSIVAIRGAMAGEELHFLTRGVGIWRAIGGIPVDANDSVAARVIIDYRSGATDTSRVWAKLP